MFDKCFILSVVYSFKEISPSHMAIEAEFLLIRSWEQIGVSVLKLPSHRALLQIAIGFLSTSFLSE